MAFPNRRAAPRVLHKAREAQRSGSAWMPFRFAAGELFPPRHDHVDIGRRDLTADADASAVLGGDQRRASAAERIEDHVAGVGERLAEKIRQADRERRRMTERSM